MKTIQGYNFISQPQTPIKLNINGKKFNFFKYNPKKSPSIHPIQQSYQTISNQKLSKSPIEHLTIDEEQHKQKLKKLIFSKTKYMIMTKRKTQSLPLQPILPPSYEMKSINFKGRAIVYRQPKQKAIQKQTNDLLDNNKQKIFQIKATSLPIIQKLKFKKSLYSKSFYQSKFNNGESFLPSARTNPSRIKINDHLQQLGILPWQINEAYCV